MRSTIPRVACESRTTMRRRELLLGGLSLPLVALTGFGQEQDKDAAANSGFVAHLIKPVAMGDLLQAIRRFAAR